MKYLYQLIENANDRRPPNCCNAIRIEPVSGAVQFDRHSISGYPTEQFYKAPEQCVTMTLEGAVMCYSAPRTQKTKALVNG